MYVGREDTREYYVYDCVYTFLSLLAVGHYQDQKVLFMLGHMCTMLLWPNPIFCLTFIYSFFCVYLCLLLIFHIYIYFGLVKYLYVRDFTLHWDQIFSIAYTDHSL